MLRSHINKFFSVFVFCCAADSGGMYKQHTKTAKTKVSLEIKNAVDWFHIVHFRVTI